MEATNKQQIESGKPTDGSPSAVIGNSEANRVAEAVDQTKQVLMGAYETASQTVKETYDRTSRTVNETYGLVKSYSHQHPGTVTLIAFGAGIGVTLLLYGSRNSRRRTRRIVLPVMDACRNVVLTLLR